MALGEHRLGVEQGHHDCVYLKVGTGIGAGLFSHGRLVDFFNPSLVVLGGGVLRSGDFCLAAVKEVVFRRSLPLAPRDLVVTRSPLGQRSGAWGPRGWSSTSCSRRRA
jgi:predicted NBD/HSP70 family sugar kinase